jgi:hypothetical protein
MQIIVPVRRLDALKWRTCAEASNKRPRGLRPGAVFGIAWKGELAGQQQKSTATSIWLPVMTMMRLFRHA